MRRSLFSSTALTLIFMLSACAPTPSGSGETGDAARLPPQSSAVDAEDAVTSPSPDRPLDATDAAGAPQADAPLRCTSDAQCAVKNVGNCCGQSLACVHVDQAVDPAAVKRRCEAEGLSSICGFRDIAGCACEAGRCVESTVPSAESLQ